MVAQRRKKTIFRREDRHKKKKMKGKWRYPKGIHSKMRHGFRGRAPVVNVGYQTDASIRGKTLDGKTIKLVSRVEDLAGIESSDSIIVIAKTVGARKRLAVIEAAQKASLSVLNIKDAAKYSSKVKETLENNKKLRSEKLQARQSKQKEQKSKKSDKKDDATAQKTTEEKKEEERAEKEKVLTQRT